MKKKTYRGWLYNCSFNFLAISEEISDSGPSLARLIEDDWSKGERVFLRNYISDAPMNEEQADEALIQKMYVDDPLEATHVLVAYSEYTVEAWEQELRIGGHNLIDELETYLGKYAVIIVEEPSI